MGGSVEIAGPAAPTRRFGWLRRRLPLRVGVALIISAGVLMAARLPDAMRFDDRSGQVNRVEGQFTSLRSQVASLQSQIAAIDSKVAAVEGDQAKLSDEVARQRRTIKDLRSQVKELQG